MSRFFIPTQTAKDWKKVQELYSLEGRLLGPRACACMGKSERMAGRDFWGRHPTCSSSRVKCNKNLTQLAQKHEHKHDIIAGYFFEQLTCLSRNPS